MRVSVNCLLRTILFLCICSSLQAQGNLNFGKLKSDEKKLTTYENDPTANAVMLYERGDNYFEVIENRICLLKTYHSKIKILNVNAFDKGSIRILLRKNGSSREKVTNIRAVTHIGNNQYNVMPSEIFTTDISEFSSEKTFTFPKIQIGCIIEYSYTIVSPFVYNFRGWDFQSDIPKIYSEFNAKIPANYVYNRAIIGNQKLAINEAKIEKGCFKIDGFSGSADCEILKYVMKDIPAFKTENDFMLSKSNYISRIDFELSEYRRLDGTTDKYTKSWKDVDKEFKSDKNIGRQLNKKNFFEKNVPENLLTEGDPLTRAKNIYSFVKSHFTWTENYGIYGNANVKAAFDEQKGNVSEINMSLINLLNTGDIQTNLMLLSTRDQGLPKRTHPVMSDFNYAIAMAKINGKEYLLDATDKHMPFGLLPYRALNHYGRVMDFNNDSYWKNIIPESKNLNQVRVNVKFDVEANKVEGIFNINTRGYPAVATNKAIESVEKEDYVTEWETQLNGESRILSYEHLAERSTDSRVTERFFFETVNIFNGDMVYFNPFFILFFEKNPFSLPSRDYPIDFGYPRHYIYQVMITIPEGYEIESLPESKAVQLGGDLITLKFDQKEDFGQIGMVFDFNLKKSHLEAQDYPSLKGIFKHVTDIQNNSLVVFKKK